jgi:hypothetical protein
MNEEWLHEPNELLFKIGKFRCIILRQAVLHHLCGYIGIPKDHPFFKKGSIDDLQVHGGITWRGPENPIDEKSGAVHWIGFDCAHMGDLIPGQLALYEKYKIPINWHGTYRNIEYVKEELRNLAEQIGET